MNKYLLMTCAMLMALPAYATTDELIENVKNKNLTAVETLLAGGENVNGTNAQGFTLCCGHRQYRDGKTFAGA